MSALLPIEELVTGSFIRQRNTVISQMYNASLRCLKKNGFEEDRRGKKRDENRKTKNVGTVKDWWQYKNLHIFEGKSRKFRKMEKPTINYASARHNDIYKSN